MADLERSYPNEENQGTGGRHRPDEDESVAGRIDEADDDTRDDVDAMRDHVRDEVDDDIAEDEALGEDDDFRE